VSLQGESLSEGIYSYSGAGSGTDRKVWSFTIFFRSVFLLWDFSPAGCPDQHCAYPGLTFHGSEAGISKIDIFFERSLIPYGGRQVRYPGTAIPLFHPEDRLDVQVKKSKYIFFPSSPAKILWEGRRFSSTGITMVLPKKPGIEFPSITDRAYLDYKRHRKVADIMCQQVVTTTDEATMAEAARVMGEKRIGSLIVVQYGTPIGIVTERDLLSTVIAGGLQLDETPVRPIMSYPLIKICPSLEIREAARTMIRKKGRLAVFECGEMVGIVTASDLIREMPDAPESSLVADDYMTKKVITADEGETVTAIAMTMGKKRIGSVIVTSKGKPAGIFTERDLLSKFFARGGSTDIPVREAASSPLVTAPAGISIHEAARIMASKHIRRLPLVTAKRIAGIITARDLVEGYAA
jgi:CBS domain-containing protein